MEIRTKELDKSLGIFKFFLASVANIDKKHHFLVFETDTFLMTVDYYEKNELVIRIGDHSFVMDLAKS